MLASRANCGGDCPAKPDPNIDHRRVPNLMAFFRRAGYAVPLAHAAADYLPGDIVVWDLGRGILHIGIVADLESVAPTPLTVHNTGAGAREEDIRIPAAASVSPVAAH